MSIIRDTIRRGMARSPEVAKKTVSFTVDDEKLRSLDAIARTMATVSGQTKTRNMVLDMAIDAFIAEAMSAFEEDGIAFEGDVPPTGDGTYDTVILPFLHKDSQKTFVEEHGLRYARFAQKRTKHIKYVAAYVGLPTSDVTHYARVRKGGFVYDTAQGKYAIEFEGAIIPLAKPLPLGDIFAAATRAPLYTTLKKLLTATEYKNLL